MTRRCFLFLPIAMACAQTRDDLLAGFHHLYHLRFADGRAAFLAWQRAHPADPLGYIAEAASHLFEEFEAQNVLTVEFFLDDNQFLDGIKGKPNASRIRAFEIANQKGRDIAENERKQNAQDSNAVLALTLAAGMSADSLSILEKRQLAALRQIRAADALGRQLVRIAPSIAEAYVALGAANYILGCLPAYKRAALWFGGLQGDRARGLDQLTQAARRGTLLAPYAKILLALALCREKRAPEARQWMEELLAEFPASPLFQREKRKIDRMAGIAR